MLAVTADLFADVDRMNASAFASYRSEDGVLRFGYEEPVTGRAAIEATISPESDHEPRFAGLVGLAPADFEQIKAVCAANEVEFLDPPTMP